MCEAIPLAMNLMFCYKANQITGLNSHTMMNTIPQIIPSGKLQEYSRNFVAEFIKKTDDDPSYAIDLSFYPTRDAYEAAPARAIAGPVYSEQQGDRFTIHICEERLKDIPSLVLQGWLEHEMMLCIQKRQAEFNQFNFRKNILPLMPVSGLAENHIRELVASLEAGLKNYLATKTIIEMGGGFQQAHFYFFRISPMVEDRSNYQKVLAHPWTKALFLCRKFREFMPIYGLADNNVEFSQDLTSYWWRAHAYLMPEDEFFLKELADIPHRYSDAPYPDIVIEVFKKVKAQFLAPKTPSDPSSPSLTLH